MSTPLCPKGHITQEENDCVSHYVICRVCGWLQHVLPNGDPYIPPPQLDPEDSRDAPGVEAAVGYRGPQHRTEHRIESRRFRDGCMVHPHCLTCPLPDCVVGDISKQRRAALRKAQALQFGGKPPVEVTAADVRAEAERDGITVRSAFRRRARLVTAVE